MAVIDVTLSIKGKAETAVIPTRIIQAVVAIVGKSSGSPSGKSPVRSR